MLLFNTLGTSTCFEVMSYAFEVRLFIRKKIRIEETRPKDGEGQSKKTSGEKCFNKSI